MTTFGIDYHKVSLNEIKSYDMVIVEPDQYSQNELRGLTQSRTKILGYLSMSEVQPSRSYFHKLKDGNILGENKNWNSYYMNLADSSVRAIILDSVVPGIMEHGLDGLLLDTIDGVAPYMPYRHLQDEMVDMIRNIRNRYPEAILIQNGGLFLLSKTQQYIDGVMLESIATTYDFETQQYTLRSFNDFQERVHTLERYSDFVENNLYLVDYVNSEDMAQQVRNRLDSLSYPYYLSRIQLDSLQFISRKGFSESQYQ